MNLGTARGARALSLGLLLAAAVPAAAGEWTAVPGLGGADQSFADLFVLDAQNAWIVGSDKGAGLVLHWSGGALDDWTAQALPADAPPLRAVVFIDAEEGWAVGDERCLLHYSGGSWTAAAGLGSGLESLAAVHFVDALHGWVASDDGQWVRATSDGGASWDVPVTPGGRAQDVLFVDTDNGVLALSQAGSFHIKISDSGGSFWDDPTTPISAWMYALAGFDGQTVFAAGEDRSIFRGELAGMWSWQQMHSGGAGSATLYGLGFAVADWGFGWAVGANGAALHTTDAGQSWVADAVAVADAELTGVGAVDRNLALAVADTPTGAVLLHYGCSGDADCQGSSLCALAESCQAGVCQWTPVDCDDGNPCTDDACLPASGDCQHADNTASCEAVYPCTTGDLCAGGVCNPGSPVADLTSCDGGSGVCCAGVCQTGDCCGDADCDDANPCTDETCSAYQCSFSNNSAGCDDGDWCTVGDFCSGGACQPGPARDCSALDAACRQGFCDEAEDRCDWQPIDEGQPCDDGSFCNTGETCQAGTCAGGGPRDCSAVADQCKAGRCDEQQQACLPEPLPDGTDCDDGNPCTAGDACAAGTCLPGSPVPDMTGCAAGSGVCCDGTCATGDCCTDADCQDGSPCTDDACLDHRCTFTANDASCDDGAWCTVGDTCAGGVCQPGPARDCSALDAPCRQGACDEIQDRCTAEPAAEGQPCDDGVFCNTGETCQAGTCTGGGPRDCSAAADQCNAGRCDEAQQACLSEPLPDGTDCDDGSLCTDGDYCIDGACTGADNVHDCSHLDEPPCWIGWCDPQTDTCERRPDPGAACDDGDACTEDDVCDADGICRGTPRPCPDCRVCDPADGACVADPAAAGAGCADGAGCSGLCDAAGRCVVEAWCGRAIDGCPGVAPPQWGAGADCRLGTAAVTLDIERSSPARGPSGLVAWRIHLEGPPAELVLRLDLRPQSDPPRAAAGYVVGSARAVTAGLAIEEQITTGGGTVLLWLQRSDPAEAGVLDLLLEAPAGRDPVVALDVWAACEAEAAERGCHPGFAAAGTPDRVQADAAGRERGLQAVTERRWLHLSGRPAGPGDAAELGELMLGCSCAAGQDAGGGWWPLGLLVLILFGGKRRRC